MQDDRRIRVAKHRRHIRVGRTTVDDNREAGLRTDRQLPGEHLTLDRAWRVIVVIVEASLAHRHHRRIIEQTSDPVLHLRRPTRRLVRVHAGGGDPPETLGQRDGVARRFLAVTDHHHRTDAGRSRPHRHLVPVAIELLGTEVAMRIDQHRVSWLWLVQHPA